MILTILPNKQLFKKDFIYKKKEVNNVYILVKNLLKQKKIINPTKGKRMF